ncbi:MAG: deoxyribonuclease V [Chloroflexi bacterium]|nr:deoxyribonuclease V [Chloroflexota bacterium]
MDEPHRSFPVPHLWRVSPAEARAIQLQLRERVLTEDRFGPLRSVAGVDLGFFQAPDGGTLGRAVVVVLTFPDLEPLEEVEVHRPVEMPYIPGLLSFREAPAALAAFERLERLPDLVLVDGQGIAHPRRFGIACHLGVLLDLPTIGVAKSILVGKADPPGEEPGACSYLRADGELLGAALRTRRGTAPVYVSIGHRVSLPSAIRLVIACTRTHRLPEPTYLADRRASRRGRVKD